MEFRKRSRSNPLNDDDDDLIHINNYNKSKLCCSCKYITWIFKVICCQKRAPKALNSPAYISQV